MRPNLQKRGKNISKAVEVVNLSPFGFWIYADNREFFLSFEKFPWFRQATIQQICNIVCEHKDHFHWPELDIDLDLDRIANPDRYPLVSK
ncbi:MAG TPA: DUF2442 domain-containing protein [Myxococcota bacterium]|nr:DUF2442 domain-containing protein [Myxococcota bacterium]